MSLFNKKILVGVIIIFLAGCSSNQMGRLPEVIKVDRVIPYHIVREGESVGSIASEHSMTRADLIKLNKLTPPYQLYNGQRLIINIHADEVHNDSDIIAEETTDKSGNAETLNTPSASTQSENTVNSSEDTATIDEVRSESNGQSESIVQPEPESEYIWPIAGGKSKISQSFNASSDGAVIMQASAGTPVKAIADGIVRIAKTLDGEAASYGKTVIILHNGKSKLSVYSHLQEYSVKINQKVKKGDIIGKVGKTGNAKIPQLYLQIFDINKTDKSRTPIDPEKILP